MLCEPFGSDLKRITKNIEENAHSFKILKSDKNVFLTHPQGEELPVYLNFIESGASCTCCYASCYIQASLI